MIDRTANRFGVEGALVHAVIAAESAYDPNAISSAGAIGLMQLMPGTAADYGVNNRSALFDPNTNVRVGIRHLKRLLDKYGNDFGRVIMAYNAGEGVVDRTNSKVTYAETLNYTEAVIHKYRKLGGQQPTNSVLQQVASLRRAKGHAAARRSLMLYLDGALLPKTSPRLQSRLLASQRGKSLPLSNAVTVLEPWREKGTGVRPAVDPVVRFRKRSSSSP